MSRFNAIDLSRLAPPPVVKTVAYETLFEEMKVEVASQLPDLAPSLELESEPVTQLLRVCAYHRMLDRLEFNDGARACMLALSTGPDLDQLAAFWGVTRQVIQEADPAAHPPVPEILEEDGPFRERVQLSLEGHSSAGPVGAYTFWALSADPKVKDVSVTSPLPGDVRVVVLSKEGDGTPDQALLDAVAAKLNDDEIRPLTDNVLVQPVTIVPFSIEAELILFDGPDTSTVQTAANLALSTYLDQNYGLGRDITLSGIFAALRQPGVERVLLTSPVADIEIYETQAPFCPATSIAVKCPKSGSAMRVWSGLCPRKHPPAGSIWSIPAPF